MKIKNEVPAKPEGKLVSTFHATPGKVYRNKFHVYDGSPHLFIRAEGVSMVDLRTGKSYQNQRGQSVYCLVWIEADAHVVYQGDMA